MIKITLSEEIEAKLPPEAITSEPDPAWDYAEIWKLLKSMDYYLQATIDETAEQEGATLEYDRELSDRLKNTIAHAAYILSLLDDTTHFSIE
jgi:hypothetical protein